MQATQVDFPQATRKEWKRASDWGGCATYARKMDDTFDGRNPAPVDMVNVPLFTGFYTSQVVQEFFHQQYGRFANKWLPCQIPQSFCIFLEGFGYDLTLSRNVAIPIFPESVQRRKVLSCILHILHFWLVMLIEVCLNDSALSLSRLSVLGWESGDLINVMWNHDIFVCSAEIWKGSLKQRKRPIFQVSPGVLFWIFWLLFGPKFIWFYH